MIPPFKEGEAPTWNRRIRRRIARSKGLLIHAFCGLSRNPFEEVAREHGLAHVTIDQREDLLRPSTYHFLMSQAIQGRWLGGPPCRTYPVCRYQPLQGSRHGPRPLRNRGESVCEANYAHLTRPDVAMRQVDDLLFLRYLVLFDVAAICNQHLQLPPPAFGLEQPEDPER